MTDPFDQPITAEDKATRSRVLRRAWPALTCLLEAFECARDSGRSIWEFAVEFECLREAGLMNNDLRWLVCRGYVELAEETTAPGAPLRTFKSRQGLTLDQQICLVLTEQGIQLLQEPVEDTNEVRIPHLDPETNRRDLQALLTPEWDRDYRELRLGGIVVKHFKVPAANQEMILSVFEEEGWPPRIDDPLPPHPHKNSKRRLHDTINALNRKQKNPLIHFHGDGRGEGIRWDLLHSLTLSRQVTRSVHTGSVLLAGSEVPDLPHPREQCS